MSEFVFLIERGKRRNEKNYKRVSVPLSEFVFLIESRGIGNERNVFVSVPLSEFVFLIPVPLSPHKIKSKKTLCVPKLISSKIY